MSQTRTIFCAVLAYFLWSVSDAFVKISGQANVSPWTIMAGLGFVGALGILGSTVKKRHLRALLTKHPVALVSNAALSIINYYSVIVAFRHLPLTMFYVIAFTTPLAIALFSALLKQERLTRMKIACLVAGFAGALIAIGPTGSGGDWIGYTAAIICVMVFAASTLVLRKLATSVTIESTQFIKCAFMTVAGFIGVAAEGTPLPSAGFLGIIVVCGILSIVGSVLFNKAVQHTYSSNVVQYHYTQLVWGALFGYLIWNDVPTWNLALGAAIIIAAGFTVVWQTRRDEKLRQAIEAGMPMSTAA